MGVYETEHYVFHYEEQSYAGERIENLAEEQEACFRHIANCLGMMPKDKIHYYFFDTPEEVGRECERRFGDYFPSNGLSCIDGEEYETGEKIVMAVYSEKIKAVGCHEDTHLFSYALGMPQAEFLLEGLACYVEELWWGISNQAWVSYYVKQGSCPSVVKMFENEYFESVEGQISYPLSGAFVHYLVMRFGMERFLKFYVTEIGGSESAASSIFGYTLAELENDFLQYISLLHYDKAVIARIEERLAECKNS